MPMIVISIIDCEGKRRNARPAVRRPPLLARGERDGCPDELIAAGAGLRAELLRATDVHVGGVQVALGVHAELVHAPEAAGELAERAPREEELAGQVVLQDLLRV